MRLNLNNQPIISLDQAEIVGQLDGVIIDGFEVMSVFSRSSNIIFYIDSNDVKIGPDAVIIRNCALMMVSPSNNYKYMSSLSDIYNSTGKFIGKLSGVEIDSKMKITKLYTENREIDVFEVINIGAVIIIDEKLISNYKEPEAIDYSEPKINHEIKQVDKNGEEHQEFDIDNKYTYLLGKKLIDELCINGNSYNKGSTIDIFMIKEALDNNLIVNLIMDAEE